MYHSLSMPEFDQLYRRNPELVVLDVREPAEFARGHLPGSINVPLFSLPQRVAALPKAAEYFVICQSGNRSAQACSWLAKEGWEVNNILGGMGAWKGGLE